MSEPVKNAEIEDVLSSIRKLVTDGGGESGGPAGKTNGQSHVQDADKLVLTDALRIQEKQAVEPLPQHLPQSDMARDMQEDMKELRDNVPSFLKRKIEIEAPSSLSSEAPELDELETNIGEAVPEFVPEAVETAVDTGVVRDDTLDGEQPWREEGAVMADWHSKRVSSVQEFEPDSPEDGDNAGTPVASLAWEDHVEEAQQVSFEGAERLEEPEAVVEEPLSFTHTAPEPTPDAAAGLAEEAIADTVIEGVASIQETEDETAYEAVLDEEMLRDLVGEIVRQELQGPLGERITRNVRKLVRREINRAMTSRSFSLD